MIPFQWRRFFTVLLTPGSQQETSWRRTAARLSMLVWFPIYALFTQVTLLLDHVFFPGFRRQEIVAPVFVIGNPRSGTTFLQRVLALDEERFTSVRTWHMILPALTAQWVVRAIGRVDALVGGPLARGISALEKRATRGSDRYHQLRLTAPEEDEGFFVHPFASGFLALVLPRADWGPYQHLDDQPEPLRRELMGFYRECLQRHLYQAGGSKRLLSKNPLFTTKIRCLDETFPDAQIIYLLRDPVEVVGSAHSLLDNLQRAQGLVPPPGASRRRDPLLKWIATCYRHAAKVLPTIPADRQTTVFYHHLVADLGGTVERIYRDLGMDIGPAFAAALAREVAAAARYRSPHRYDLSTFDIDEARLRTDLAFVYEALQLPAPAAPSQGATA